MDRNKLIIPVSVLVLVFVSLFSAGCTGENGSQDINGESSDNPGGLLVEYHRTGGFAGFNDRVLLFENKTAIIYKNGVETSVLVDDETLLNIRTIIDSEKFMALEDEYKPESQGYDLFFYEVSAKGKTVSAQDGAVPEILSQLIEEMNGIMNKASVN
ncbi:hypothetical protein F1737_08640 [Methanoplanus sp. FWC-SCC4]|uniref:Uncharacterized protein n=1 Tax=Methanochimaera problematica TaxID=2609417 RepID=A0AA97FDA2_9EURY|nr:hypothetical protein [Methanoplanus sp. FWC-SCC4]WOF16752.1 hypothetical protein F1737_08640 [Methanoplanus sp. FWC-SCC4]